MELFVNSSVDAVNSTPYFTEKLTTCSIVLDLIELLSAVTAIVINCLVIIALTMGTQSFSCRVYFSVLLKLSLAHCLLSFLAVAEFAAFQFHASSPIAVCPKLKLFLIILRNTRIAVFCGLSVPGIASISWINWWILNILINHVDRPTGDGIASAISRILWFSSLIFTFWLNAPIVYLKGNLESNIVPETQRAVNYFMRLYSLVLMLSLIVIVFSTFTTIPPIVGHLTSRSFQTKLKCLNHASCDADCVCSDSGDDNSDFKPKLHKKESVFKSCPLDANKLNNLKESLQTQTLEIKSNKDSDNNCNSLVREGKSDDEAKNPDIYASTPKKPRIVVLNALDDCNSSNLHTPEVCDSHTLHSGN